MTFDTPVSVLPFVGTKYTQLLDKLGIRTVGDLLYHLPRKYIDLSQITPINLLVLDELQVIEARVISVKAVRLRGGKIMVTAKAEDNSGTLQLIWFNQPYIEKSLVVGQTYRFAGEVEEKYGKWQMISPQAELASKPPVHTGRLVPIYNQTAGISSKWLRARIAPLLSKIPTIHPEFLPTSTLERQSLIPLPQALRTIHAPKSQTDAEQAKQRLAFDELVLLQLAALNRKSNWQQGRAAPELGIERSELKEIISQLPFELTNSQHKVLNEILQDMAATKPMNRLLEGDVGSGKTIVALLSALVAVKNGYQVAVMAPTSVLAQQHYLSFQSMIEMIGGGEIISHSGAKQSEEIESRDPISQHASFRDDKRITISLRTAKSKMEAANITIGTHALISEGLQFSNLGLVIIDEQHRFGVEQRATLMAKASQAVHLLTMTATPIPRTLALTAYGDLEVSIIDQMPVGRVPIKTHIVPAHKRADMYGFMAQALGRGEQAYIICPLVEESDNLQSVRAATTEYERLTKIFPQHRLGLLHGRMKPAEKDQILAGFKDHAYDVLIATPVVEVGIDVPNATILLVEGAERFGLAQLHQLRGRVGRGSAQSYCFLLSDSTAAEDSRRLRHIEHEHSGIRLAEIDLKTRGPGEVYGLRQSGLPELKAANFFDVELIERSRQEAEKLWQDNLAQTHQPLQAKLKSATKQIELN